MAASAKVLLRAKDTDKTQAFAPEHAERLLAYPNSQWVKVAEEKAGGAAEGGKAAGAAKGTR